MLHTQETSDRGIINAVATVAEARGVSRAQVSLAWLRRSPVVVAPLAGATKPSHIDDAIASLELELELTDDEVTELEARYTPRYDFKASPTMPNLPAPASTTSTGTSVSRSSRQCRLGVTWRSTTPGPGGACPARVNRWARSSVLNRRARARAARTAGEGSMPGPAPGAPGSRPTRRRAVPPPLGADPERAGVCRPRARRRTELGAPARRAGARRAPPGGQARHHHAAPSRAKGRPGAASTTAAARDVVRCGHVMRSRRVLPCGPWPAGVHVVSLA